METKRISSDEDRLDQFGEMAVMHTFMVAMTSIQAESWVSDPTDLATMLGDLESEGLIAHVSGRMQMVPTEEGLKKMAQVSRVLSDYHREHCRVLGGLCLGDVDEAIRDNPYREKL